MESLTTQCTLKMWLNIGQKGRSPFPERETSIANSLTAEMICRMPCSGFQPESPVEPSSISPESPEKASIAESKQYLGAPGKDARAQL